MILNLLVLAYVTKEAVSSLLSPQLQSPCPGTFYYENNTEPDKWYGVINIQTSDELAGVWITVQLDNKADLLGNWFGESYSIDNKEFRISNPDYVLEAGPPVAIRLFIQYNPLKPIPRLEKIRLNGRTICSRRQDYKPTAPTLHISKTKTTTSTPIPVATYSERDQYTPGIGPVNRPKPSIGVDPNIPISRPVSLAGGSTDTYSDVYQPAASRPNRVNDELHATQPGFNPPRRPTEVVDVYQPGSPRPNRVNDELYATQPGFNPPRRPTEVVDVYQPATPRPNRVIDELHGTLPDFNSPRGPNVISNRYTGDPISHMVTRPGLVTIRPTFVEAVTSPSVKETEISNVMNSFGKNSSSNTKKIDHNNYDQQLTNHGVTDNILFPNFPVTPVFSLEIPDITPEPPTGASNNHVRYDSSEDYTPTEFPTTPKDNSDESDFFPGDFNVLKETERADHDNTSRPFLDTTKTVGCGTVALRPKALISYGQDTTPGEWPWHAAVYHTKGIHFVYICGASLISDRHVLTAAHCVSKPHSAKRVEPEGILVYFGKYNLKLFGPETQNRNVEEIYIHPDFNYSMYYNDIAILKLIVAVEITDFVRPCCLWEGSTELETIINKEGVVIGWGFDENKKIVEKLMQAKMPIVSTIQCIFSNRDFFARFTFDKNYCAGFRNGTSVCNGDSGGSMVFPRRGTSGQNTIWQIRGIVSVGVALQTEGICDTSQYVIFTDVAKHLTWIKRILELS